MTSRPLHIVMVTADFPPNIGGIATHVDALSHALAKMGHQITVLTLPLAQNDQRRSQEENLTIYRPPIPKAKPFYSWMLKYWLQGFLKKNRVDLIHVHGLRPLEASKCSKIPVFFTNHTSGFLKRIKKGPAERKRLKKRLEHLVHLFAPSQELLDAAQSVVGFSGPGTFIPNGVDCEQFSPGTDQRARYQISQTTTIILLARRLVDKNGVIPFAKSLAFLKDENIHVLFAGSGPEEPKVQKIVQSAGMTEKTHFLGNVAHHDMVELYRMADISVLPSLMEATSITGLESMACGVPLVGTRVGGIPALIKDQYSGFLVPKEDPKALAEALKQLVYDPEKRQQMGQNSRQIALEKFQWSVIAGQTEKVYRQTLKN
ncbi:glycosyltransferase family 4 protein [Magnetococcales bacterium HHB-1]